MAERSLFFNALEISPGEFDRWYDAQDFALYFGSLLSNGLLHTKESTGMRVTVVEGTLTTAVSVGKSLIKGHLHEVEASPKILTHSIPEPNLDRIDRVVLRYDGRMSGREILLHVIEGNPSENPEPPELTRTELVHELSLAQIRVRANTSQLQQSDVYDERLINELCGLVTWLPQLDTTVFQQQWDAFMESVKDEGYATLTMFEEHAENNDIHKTSQEIRSDTETEFRAEVVSSLPTALPGEMGRIVFHNDVARVPAFKGFDGGKWV